jgi:predicted nucleic acid-binding protein
MNFINWLKKLYVPATCEELMLRELDTARRDLLIASTALNYAESIVLYNNQRIKRLTAALKECLK